MYFFYVDESGSRDPQVIGTRRDGSTFAKDHLYVLTAIGLYEWKWRRLEREIANLLERIEHYLSEYHRNHQGLIIIDDMQRQLNRAVAMKHAFFQREGNVNVRFHHIVEYPFFTESTLSNGIQLADLCAYNNYRTFRNLDFSYEFFEGVNSGHLHFQKDARQQVGRFESFS